MISIKIQVKLRQFMYGTVLDEKERTKDIEQEQQPTQFRVSELMAFNAT